MAITVLKNLHHELKWVLNKLLCSHTTGRRVPNRDLRDHAFKHRVGCASVDCATEAKQIYTSGSAFDPVVEQMRTKLLSSYWQDLSIGRTGRPHYSSSSSN